MASQGLLSLLQHLLPSASIQDAQQWLHRNRFSQFCRLFASFSGEHRGTVCKTHRHLGSTVQGLPSALEGLQLCPGDPRKSGFSLMCVGPGPRPEIGDSEVQGAAPRCSIMCDLRALLAGFFTAPLPCRSGWALTCPGRAPLPKQGGAYAAHLPYCLSFCLQSHNLGLRDKAVGEMRKQLFPSL